MSIVSFESSSESGTGTYDVLNEETFLGYQNRWSTYNELYSNINVNAIAGYSSLDYINDMLLRDIHSPWWLKTIFTYFNKAPIGILGVDMLATVIGWTDSDEAGLNYACELLAEEIFDERKSLYRPKDWAISSDLFVHLESQQAKNYLGIKSYTKKFSSYNSDIKKVSQNNTAIVHNLLPRDTELISYILNDLNYASAVTNKYIITEQNDNTIKIEGSYKLEAINNQIIIPSTINGKTVSEIGDSAFSGGIFSDASYNKIVLPSTITKIGNNAFANNRDLMNIEFGQNSNLIEIGSGAFAGCSALTNINIPDSVTKIASYAFENCDSLTSLNLPLNLLEIGQGVIKGSTSVASVHIEPTNTKFSSIDGVLYNKTKSLVLLYPSGKTNRSFTLPLTVVETGLNSFADNHYLESIELSNTVALGEKTFVGCENLSTITGNKVYLCYENVFFDTKWYKNKSDFVTIGKCLVSYKGTKTHISEDDLPKTVTTFGSDSFKYSKIESIIIPEYINTIFQNAFNYSVHLNKVIILGRPSIYHNVFDNIGKEAEIFVLKDYHKSTLDPYRENITELKTVVTLNDGLTTTSQTIYYGDNYQFPTGSQEGYSKNWYDTTGKFYFEKGKWNSFEKELSLTSTIEENVKWVKNGQVFFSYNLLNGDTYEFLENQIYINEELKYTLPVCKTYYRYDSYIHNQKVSSKIYDDTFKIVEIKEIPVEQSVRIYNNNPFKSPNEFITVVYTYEEILLQGLNCFMPGNYSEYKFLGLYTSPSFERKILNAIEVIELSNQTIYANWEVVQYTLTLNYNNGTPIETRIISALNNEIILPKAVKSNYTAEYWTAEDGLKIGFMNIYTVTEDKNLQIVWIPQTFTITYENLEGVSNLNNPKTYTIISPNLNLLNINKTGYNFKGWYSDFSFINRVTNIPKGSSNNKVLYARWELTANYTRTNTYTITDSGRLNQPYDTINFLSLVGLSASLLKTKGYSTISLNVSMDIWEKSDGYQHIFIYSGNASSYKLIFEKLIEHGGTNKKTDKERYSYSINLNLDDLGENIYITYAASGSFSDDWCTSNLRVSYSSLQNKAPCNYNHHYQQNNQQTHKSYCVCGQYVLHPHAISASDLASGNRYANCIFCGLSLDLNTGGGIIGPRIMSVNNDFNTVLKMTHTSITPSGIIVLSEKDLQAFLEGTLDLNALYNELLKE